MTSRFVPPAVVPTAAELQAFDGNTIPNNTVVMVISSALGGTIGSPRTYRFRTGDASTDALGELVVTPTVNPAGGKWLICDPYMDVQLNNLGNPADATVLFTVPANMRLHVVRAILDVSVSYTGGAASAIGLSSSNAAYATKGDLLGGAAGNIAADLVAPGFRGTNGTKVAASYATQPPVVLVAADTIRYDRITSAFTAGNANLHLLFHLMLT